LKLIFLGDSLVAGNYGGNFVNEVILRLPQHTVINAGVNGSTVMNLLDRLDSVLAQMPDGIFVLTGGNDAISFSQPETRRYYERVQNVPGGVVDPDSFVQFFRELLTRIQVAQVAARVALPPNEYNPETFSAMQRYNRIMSDTCASLNVPALDLMSALAPTHVPARPPLNQAIINQIGQRVASGWNDYETERANGGFTYSFDGLHFTPETARRVGETIVQFLLPDWS
jgi:lysophospholipase L1-like esterase